MDTECIVKTLDTSNAARREEAWQLLKPLGEKIIPYLVYAYPTFKTWHGRAALLYHGTKYARIHDELVSLATTALKDRSRIVRYRACGLLAYSLKKSALQSLQELLPHSDKNTREDIKAAIDAINAKNHHFFIDRSHSGRSFWEVQPGDRQS